MVKLIMSEKSLSNIDDNHDTQREFSNNEKNIKSNSMRKKRVDINVLKSKLQEIESKEFKRNLSIFLALILVLGFLGIYLSL